MIHASTMAARSRSPTIGLLGMLCATLAQAQTDGSFCAACQQVPVTRLLDLNADTQNQFAHAVRADGDVAVVGIPGDDAIGNESGAVVVYRQTGFGWAVEAQLIANDGAPGDQFGQSVDVSGTTIIVGAPGADVFGLNSGAAYVFQWQGESWVQTAKLLPRSAQPHDAFGSAVAISDNLAIVGSPGADSTCDVPGSVAADTCCNAGVATVFRRTMTNSLFGSANWAVSITLRSPSPQLGEGFGAAVDVQDDPIAPTVLVGAPYDQHCVSIPIPGPVGSAYLFRFVPKRQRWSEPLIWRGDIDGDRFGAAVRLDASRMLIGAPGDVGPPVGGQGGIRSGSAYLAKYGVSNATGQLVRNDTSKIYDCSGDEGDEFGAALDFDGINIIVGAPGVDILNNDSGAVYTYVELLSSIAAVTRHIPLGFEVGQRLGSSVTVTGDKSLAGAPFGPGGVSGSVPNAGTAFDITINFRDCNQNGINDACDIESGDFLDCNMNLKPDSCEILDGEASDCNANGIPDDCEDCNGNGLADECDIVDGFSADCNGNLIADECEDCNFNGFADECDIAAMTSLDEDGNGIPDECECDCIDLVFAIDDTGSMGGAIDNVRLSLPTVISLALSRSAGDLRIGLVTFKDDVKVEEKLTFDIAAVDAAISNLMAVGGAGIPEASDQALREILTQNAVCLRDGVRFDEPFRSNCLNYIVLITDALPAGCDDMYMPGIDNVNADDVALAAVAQDVVIAAVHVRPLAFPNALEDIMMNYAEVTGGLYAQVAANGSGVDVALTDLLNLCLDCNENGILDPIDIAIGTSVDANENNIPDECE